MNPPTPATVSPAVPAAPPFAAPPSLTEVLSLRHRWYHTIDLAPGVTTPGWIDVRPVAAAVAFPADLRGVRALDVGMFDGFWAFELERRGASVVGIDVDEIPPPDTPLLHRSRIAAEVTSAPGTGFEVLRRYFGSSVERRTLNVYDLTPAEVGGPKDLVVIGSLLLHLRDPVGALERVAATLAPGGELVLVEPVDPEPAPKGRWLRSRRRTDQTPAARFMAYATPWTWWLPNRACLDEWLRAAGFDALRHGRVVPTADEHGFVHHLAVVHARRG